MNAHSRQGNQISAIEGQLYPEHFAAWVRGKVEHRVGDGPAEQMPLDIEMKVETALASYVLSWVDPKDRHPEIAYLAKREFEHYVEVGALEVSVP